MRTRAGENSSDDPGETSGSARDARSSSSRLLGSTRLVTTLLASKEWGSGSRRGRWTKPLLGVWLAVIVACVISGAGGSSDGHGEGDALSGTVATDFVAEAEIHSEEASKEREVRRRPALVGRAPGARGGPTAPLHLDSIGAANRSLPPTPPPHPSIQRLFDRVIADAKRQGMAPGTIGLHLELPDGSVLSHRGAEPMTPASTVKIVTAAAALDLLGPEHPLTTELWLTGEVRGGTLTGPLVIVGHGDPATSGREFSDDPIAELRPWVNALRTRGIERIEGGIIADDRYLAGPSRLEEWPDDQLHRWYCAPSGALNLNDNCVDVEIGARGGVIHASIRPASPFFEIENVLVPTADEKRHLYAVDRTPGSWKIRLSGRFLETVARRTEWITVPDPTRAFLGAFAELLRSEGIEVVGDLRRGELPPVATRIAQIAHPVSSTLPTFLKRSQNLYGDCLFRVTDRASGGDGSFARAGETMERYLKSYVGGRAIEQVDGSGLARSNRVSCDELVRVLARADEASWSAHFWEALPIAGVDGTLSRRFRGTSLEGELRAKTGSISGVSGLVGGWESAAGPVRFAALTGGKGARVGAFKRWLDRFLVELDPLLAELPGRSADAHSGAEGPLEPQSRGSVPGEL